MIDRSVAPDIHPLGHIQLPPLDKEVLPGGLEFYTLDSGDIDVNQLFLTWRGGKYDASNRVVPSLCSAMLTEGARGLSGAQIAESLDFRGAILNAEANDHHSVMSLTCVNSLSAGLAPTLSAIVENPDFPLDALAMQVEIKETRYLQGLSKVSVLADRALSPLIRGEGHPLARQIELSDFKEVTRDKLIDFHDKVYTAASCKAFLSGRLPQCVRDDVKDFLSRMPCRRPACNINIVPFTPMPPQKVEVSLPGALQSAVAIGIPAVPRSHPDYIPLRFTVIALGGYFGSRLMRNIREDKGYTYGIHAALYGTREGAYVAVKAQCDNEHVDDVIRETAAEMERMASAPMPDDELLRLRLHVQASLMETVDSPFSIMDYYRTRELVGLPEDYFSEQLRLSREIDAPLIMEMARKYLNPLQMRIAVAGN
ncbi:MAG: insulinase family protein [Clostridium sp.]|nr:insulinase family protein [Clostridium sp.]